MSNLVWDKDYTKERGKNVEFSMGIRAPLQLDVRKKQQVSARRTDEGSAQPLNVWRSRVGNPAIFILFTKNPLFI